MQNVGFDLFAKFKARVAHYDQTPMQGIMDRNEKKILAENIHTLHSTRCCKTDIKHILLHCMLMTKCSELATFATDTSWVCADLKCVRA